MSRENVELHRRFYKTFNERDTEAFIALCDPKIEFHSVFKAVSGTVHHGHDGMRRFLEDYDDAWGGEIRVEPQAYFDLGNRTLAYFVMRARGRQSGAELTMPLFQAATWRDEKIVFLKSYEAKEEALQELGIAEDALEEIAP
jgi:ketosteroid isomerase-like protein